MNEFNIEGLVSQVFPTLFPHGSSDPTCRGWHYPVSLADSFKHLIKYSDYSPEGTHRWRFASHPRFHYWALNMIQRHQLLSQSKIYMQQNPAEVDLTIEDLQGMVGRMSSVQPMNCLQRFAAKTYGSRQYWHACYQELKALLQQT